MNKEKETERKTNVKICINFQWIFSGITQLISLENNLCLKNQWFMPYWQFQLQKQCPNPEIPVDRDLFPQCLQYCTNLTMTVCKNHRLCSHVNVPSALGKLENRDLTHWVTTLYNWMSWTKEFKKSMKTIYLNYKHKLYL